MVCGLDALDAYCSLARQLAVGEYAAGNLLKRFICVGTANGDVIEHDAGGVYVW